jgi:hypothetical protein
MELFHSVAATSIRRNRDDLAFSALPGAPVRPSRVRPSRAARTRQQVRSATSSLGVLLARLTRALTNRPTNRPATVDCISVHSPAPIQARIVGCSE